MTGAGSRLGGGASLLHGEKQRAPLVLSDGGATGTLCPA